VPGTNGGWFGESQKAGLAALGDLAATGPLTVPPSAFAVPAQLPGSTVPVAGEARTAEVLADKSQGSQVSLAGPNGRHAAPRPPYLDRRGVRFIIFSGIGGFVFVLGLALQVGLTGGLRLPAMASYLIQAVVSVEASFLLNRWITWRDRDTPLWKSFVRFNLQKTVTVALNVALYAVLLRIGMNYLIANIVLTAVFTAVNYVAGDRLVFVTNKTRRAEPHAPPALGRPGGRKTPQVSVVIPCRDNQSTVGDAVQSLLAQDYPGLREIILIGSPDDATWQGLQGIVDSRIALFELETPPGLRDANFKRDAGIRMTGSDLVALVDSDIVLPSNWMTLAVSALEENGASCVTGGMKSIHDTFWGRYTDSTWIGAKTPRVAKSYTVTSENFGAGNRKPPITANTLFTRKLYEACPIDPSWSHGSYEDYEWFWRVTRAGYEIVVSTDLFGWHHHRRGLRALAKEYRRSSRGCAYFIRAHLDSPLARRRLRQVIIVPLAGLATVVAAAAATASDHGEAVAAAILACAALLIGHQVTRSRRLESAAYPLLGAALGAVFTTGLITNLVRSSAPATHTAGKSAQASRQSVRVQEIPTGNPPQQRRKRGLRRMLLHPLVAILAVQSGLSLSLVWSNTAFGDEANYLSLGHELIGSLFKGTSWPSAYAHSTLSGSPFIYPPIGAIADSVGGLAAARALSLLFLLCSTVLLYSTAQQLFGRAVALIAAALWAVHSPTLQLGAFATYDAMSVSLTALAAWLGVRAAHSRYRGELVAASALTLALANATAYSGIVIDPLVIAFVCIMWWSVMGRKQALFSSAWFTAVCLCAFCFILTITKCWRGLTTTVLARSVTASSGYSTPLHVFQDSWTYTGLIILLATMGAVVAFFNEDRSRGLLVSLLALAALAVPLAQAHDTTAVSLKKHLAYGAWFAVMAAGYACQELIPNRLSNHRVKLIICGLLAFMFPAVNGWWSAWHWYQSWNNASSLMAAVRPYVDRTTGYIDLPQQGNAGYLCRFYLLTQGDSWQRCAEAVPNPTQLNSSGDGVIVLAYATSVAPPSSIPKSVLLTPNSAGTRLEMLNFIGSTMNAPQLSAATLSIERDPQFRVVAEGAYNSNQGAFIYVVWVRR